jgi:hypothetical protein
MKQTSKQTRALSEKILARHHIRSLVRVEVLGDSWESMSGGAKFGGFTWRCSNNQTHSSSIIFQWYFPSFYGDGLVNEEAEPQLRDNVNSKDGSLALCSWCGLFPLLVLIGAVLSSPHPIFFVLHLVWTLLD